MSSVEAVSKAVACLRVLIHGIQGRPASPELNVLVGKLINAFLETRWAWPRQFSQMTPYAFVLTDPRVQELDRATLQSLSKELQLKLFGDSGSGEVALLVFEGDEMEVHRFAGLDPAALDRVLAGEVTHPPFDGQLCRVTADGAEPLSLLPPPPSAPSQDSPDWAVSFSTPKFERNYEPVYRGLYFIPTRRFFGNVALCKPIGAATIRDTLATAQILPGVATDEFDEACVESAGAAIAQAPGEGLIFIPLNFSSLVRPAGRQVYARFLEKLPESHRAKLVAAIYETPRDPSFFALSQIRNFLTTHFSQINLLVSDPAFEIDKLATGVVTGATLVLPENDPNGRMAAIRWFMQHREVFKRKQIWPGVSRVTTRAELELCLAMRVPAISGPIVADLRQRPVPAMQRELENLPLREV